MNFKINIPAFILFCLLTGAMTGCYYDKAELLYPDGACDTAAVTYSTTIMPIISANCNSCHGGSTPSGGVKLDTYAGISVPAASGRLWGAVSHASGFSPMPKNSPKLSACNLSKIKAWLDAGHPNN